MTNDMELIALGVVPRRPAGTGPAEPVRSRVRTVLLHGPALDYAVARALTISIDVRGGIVTLPGAGHWHPSVDWAQAGPLFDRFQIRIGDQPRPVRGSSVTMASIGTGPERVATCGPTILVAACRAIVMAHLGDSVFIPAELQP